MHLHPMQAMAQAEGQPAPKHSPRQGSYWVVAGLEYLWFAASAPPSASSDIAPGSPLPQGWLAAQGL